MTEAPQKIHLRFVNLFEADGMMVQEAIKRGLHVVLSLVCNDGEDREEDVA